MSWGTNYNRKVALISRVLSFSNDCHDPANGRFCDKPGHPKPEYTGKPGPKARNYDEYGRQVSQTGELHGRRNIREVRVAGKTAYVPLSDDEHSPNAVVDSNDTEIVNKYGWTLNKDGHPYTKIRGKNVSMHELLTGEKNPDHINRDKLDNRRANLRTANKTLNEANTTARKTNTSGYKGVVRDSGSWKAQIGSTDSNGKYRNINLGRFDTPEKAAEAYNKKAKELHGDYAYQNIIPPK